MIVTALRPVNGYEDFVNPARSSVSYGREFEIDDDAEIGYKKLTSMA